MAQTPANARTRQQWVEIIGADWRKSIDSIIQTGRDLIAAKAELPHGEFTKMFEGSQLPFGYKMAWRLMKIAEDPKLSNIATNRYLPASWQVLSSLTKLTKDEFEAGIEKGIITPETSVREAVAYAGAVKLPEGETWGTDRAPASLPTPEQARKIARETGRFVAASDNNIYSGATKEEGEAYRTKLIEGTTILEAIETLAAAPDAGRWFKQAERHWFIDFRPGAVDDAREWLASLKEAMGVVDA